MPDDIATLAIRVQSLEVETAEIRLKRLSEAGRDAEMQAGKNNNTWKATAGILASLGIGATALSVAVNSSVTAWVSYDKAIKEVRSITGQSREEFAHYREEVLAVASAVGVDASLAARGLYETLSAGIPKENAVAFLATASKTAVAGVTDVDTAVNGLTNVINAFRLPVTQAEDIANKMLQTVNDGKITFSQLSKEISDASVPMAAIGGSFEELNAQVAAITSQGVPASVAMTQIKGSINALFNPSKEMLEVLGQIGTEFNGIPITTGRAAVAQFGFAGTIEKISDALRGNDAALFGAMRNQEGFAQVLETTGKNSEALAKFYKNQGEASGVMANSYKVNAETLGVSLDKLKTSAIGLVEKMENSFGIIGEFSKLLQGAAILIDKISNTETSGGTENALFAANSIGGTQGAAALKRQIDKLTADKSALESQLRENPPGLLDIAVRASPLGSVLTDTATDDLSNLKQMNVELKTLTEAYDKYDGSLKRQAETKRELKTIQDGTALGGVLPEKGAIESARLTNELDAEIKANERLVEIKKLENELGDKAKNDATAQALKAAAEYEAKIAGEKKVAEAKEHALDLADRLGTNQRETLESEVAILETVKGQNDATENQIRKADAGIAKLKEQLSLLDETGNRIPAAKAIREPQSSKAGEIDPRIVEAANFESLFQKTTETAFDQLAKQESDLIKSYEKRRHDILYLTNATEIEKRALLQQAAGQMAQAQQQQDKAMLAARVNASKDMFSQLASIQSAFGEKGFKIAQGAAIASATIEMVQSSITAYKNGLVAGGPYLGQVLGPTFAAVAIAAGTANIARIKSQTYSGAYEQGGIVGGSSFSGDNLTASVNSGEMILNRSQQKKLFEMSNKGAAPATGTNSKVEINIINNSGENVTRRESTQGDKQMIEIIVGRAKQAVNDDLRKGGTPLDRTMKEVYNQKRA